MISFNRLLMYQRFFASLATQRSTFEDPKTSLYMLLKNDTPEQLNKCLNVLSQSGLNLTRIESKPISALDSSKGYQISIDFLDDDQSKVQTMIKQLENSTQKISIFDGTNVPYFPRSRKDLDGYHKKILVAGDQLQSDHPGFHDQEYIKRRQQIAKLASSYKFTEKEIPIIQYTQEEVDLWVMMYGKLKQYNQLHAVPEYLEGLQLLEKNCGFNKRNVPQLQDINPFLREKTNFNIFPIAGQLNSRDFLNGLAFRTFFSTQYIRHPSVPGYTPEPDIIHELIGHVPLFTNQEFADFSQEIGMASLGASDDEIKKLAANYWFSIEYGLIKNENKELKFYGAAILSSAGEIENILYKNPQIREWDPQEAESITFPYTTFQPLYLYTSSFKKAQKLMREYANSIKRKFNLSYNIKNDCIEVDRKIKMLLNQ